MYSRVPIILRVELKSQSRHVKEHTRPCKCTVADCNESFAWQTGLARHMRDKHSTRRWYCTHPDCSSYKLGRDGTARKENLDRHIRKRHGGQVP
ncbi:hypothetical protein BGZ61DRAFT_66547 [Ilyonectria robusta]|uniref:uncharacterized protein n=1 Tax=Ilyonectria robusta TaxID=1079257 RepID=UPI001E8E8833|nr:uncharacterized protein BGZ61DRAFT_66547 [Ilyonectria robusta]KAH8680340.1 hypothetical protein BGZ61DRAFT_66547 [Ilyonectria robusta]